MKKIFFFIALAMSLRSLSAQTYGYNYQAVVRDGGGQVAANQSVQLRFQIQLENGQSLYEETHSTVADAFGRVARTVGAGLKTYGAFDTLKWTEKKHFLAVAIKIAGAVNWVEMGREEIVLPPFTRLAQDEKFVGIFPISGFEEGAAVIEKNTWQIVTRTEYRLLERMFQQPIPSGMTRHYYLFIRKADNVDNCADSTDWRFYYPWDKKPGHQFKIWRDWGALNQGSYIVVEILPIQAQHNQYTHAYWQLEAKIPSSCTGKRMRVLGVSVFAIDKLSATVPELNLNKDAAEGTEPNHDLGGSGGALTIKPNGYADIYANLYINLKGFSGTQGRDAIHIEASDDNTDGVILVNKPGIAFWSKTLNSWANIICRDASVRQLTVTGGDVAEARHPTAHQQIQPGMVVIFDEKEQGKIRTTNRPYDPKVAGVISGAGKYFAGVCLLQEELAKGAFPLAQVGTVEVLCVGPVAVGDLLTTSSVPGYAMAVRKPLKGIGAAIGKATTTLKKGERGLVEMQVEKH